MHLYNLTLVPPSNVTAAVVGQFSGTKQQEVVVCRAGSRLELLRPDVSVGKARRVLEQHAFGVVRSLASFRLTGGSKDYLIVGSDSGRITIAEYDAKTNSFAVVHQETYGRSGSRRVVAGQYLATDPKGRAVMIGAVEKAKLVYILNRDSAANLTISSPLEAHRPNAIIHAIVGVDVGYENPLFATLEVDYEDSDRDPTGEAFERAEKLLTYYELDLGLNHVVRKWSTAVDMRSNHLVQVPGGFNQNSDRWEGPSGVLVCSEDYITYKHNEGEDHRLPIPRRKNPVEVESERRGTIIVASVCHRMKASFFFLLQTEDGDLFKVTIDHKEEVMQRMKIKYFDTVPVAANLCILRAGFLYVAAENGSTLLYSFQKLGDEDDLPEYSSDDLPALGMSDIPPAPPLFAPRPLVNLLLTDELSALDPLVDAKLLHDEASGGIEGPKIVTACGKGPRSSLKVLQHGLDVQEAISSELPGVPKSVWTTKLQASDEFDSYIILSFVNGTLVLSIGEMIEEVSDSGFMTSAPTLAVQQLGQDALLQVHPTGIRHILSGARQPTEWPAPMTSDGRQATIVQAATNERQVVVALEPTNEIVYFELDMDGQLNEYQERKGMGAGVVTLSMASVPEGRQRTPYLAVGCDDNTVRVVSLDPDSTLATISIQALTAAPNSICVAEMNDMTIDRNHPTFFVNIGLVNGVLLRTILDPTSGQLTDTRTRFLGAKPVKLVPVKVQGTQPAVLALSSRSWLSYTYQDRTHFTPLLFDALDDVWTFSAGLCPEGLIGIIGDSLRIFTIPTLGTKIKADSIPLSYTPRKITSHPERPHLFYTVESDNRTLSPWEAKTRLASMGKDLKVGNQGVLDLDEAEFGPVRAGAGHWSSCVRIVDVTKQATTFKLQLEENEAAFSLALVNFLSSDNPQETYLVVGTGQETRVTPRESKSCFLHVYRLSEEGQSLVFVHKTPVDDVALVLESFQGRLLAGVGKSLRIYDLGKKKLLRKSENKSFSNSVIVSLRTQGSRIIVGDMQDSVFFCAYKPRENRFVVFAEDVMPRYTTATTMLDYETVCVGDRFGNVAIVRQPDAHLTEMVDEDPSGQSIVSEKPFLQGASAHKVHLEAHFYVGDVVTSLQKVRLVAGGRDVILYTCLGGTVGALVPFVAKDDVETMSMLEQHIRQETNPAASLVGRDHLSYRGYYTPVKAVVDGDLCETFGLLPHARQAAIAEELNDRTPSDINKKLESLRTTSAF
ncbi:hypothetical protein FA10DRAFT_147967 [Acaromyces ingoldii]|uniref:Splicing factor 3B subunit 3 n=1 Tax=Acaromyces ingoldii TaxID=215250 RepID=A0A316YND7_9BASI|nr:hypothetical protein FA10DRAFT_147967 [Acaromyces ingoldii]PWN89573.1 hypothetical protein FA10DRAFT_147967 [Acaromyces ingoldii]